MGADEIEQCQKLPDGWRRVKFDKLWQSRLCPSLKYEWLENQIICE